MAVVLTAPCAVDIGGKTMSTNVYDILLERGFIEQATNEDEIREMLGKEKVTFYIDITF